MAKISLENIRDLKLSQRIGLSIVLCLIVVGLGIGLAMKLGYHKPAPVTATSLYKDKKYDQAIDSVKKDISSKPDDATNYNFLANIYRDKGQTDLAIENYHKAIELNDKFAQPRVNLASMLINLGKKDDAKSVIEDGLKAFPDNKLLEQLQDQIK
jgi:tetratricopeptide (TPR) repeat protein